MPVCEICSRGALKANWRSHSNAKITRRQKLNLQSKKVDGKRVLICTSCLRTLSKKKTK
jgi:ribosomal protein L28